MKKTSNYDILVNIYLLTRFTFPESLNLHQRWCEKLKPKISVLFQILSLTKEVLCLATNYLTNLLISL